MLRESAEKQPHALAYSQTYTAIIPIKNTLLWLKKKNVVPFLPSTFFFRHFSSGLSAQFLIHTSFCSSHNSKESVFTFIFLTAHSWRGTVSSEAALGLLKQDFSSDNCSSSITLCALPLALCLCMYNNEKGILPLQYIT